MRLVLLGSPGTGKGTLATTLKQTFDLLHISTGDILREEMKNKTKIGNEIKELMDSGDLVRDELVGQLVQDTISRNENKATNVIFDGYPRTVQQAQDLNKFLDGLNQPLHMVLYLESSPELIIRRLTGRRVCEECGAVYHITNRPPKKAGICDFCGSGSLVKRKDDTEDTIRHRMEVYDTTVAPLIKYYETLGKLRRVDSDRDPEEVQKDLIKFLDE